MSLMRKLWLSCVLVLSFPLASMAQRAPAGEIFGGYSLERADVTAYMKTTRPPVTFVPSSQNVHVNGWNASLTENLNRWIGGTLDFGGHYGKTQPFGTENRVTMYSFLYGPRVSYRKIALVTPFAHALFGATHANVKVKPVGPEASDTAFAMAAGGGVDVNLGSRLAIRVIQAEYFRTNIFGTKQSDIRASAGVVFHFGKRR